MYFPGSSVVKNPPARQETQVQSLGQEDPLGKEMTTYSSMLSGEILWAEEPERLQSMGSQKSHIQRAKQQQHYVLSPGSRLLAK